MVISIRSPKRNWRKVSFASTLHLFPVLDLLLSDIPDAWHCEVRLGLQEALVNAAKHGNGLDPSKQVFVRYSHFDRQYWWVIADQGSGFEPPCCCEASEAPPADVRSPIDALLPGVAAANAAIGHDLPCDEGECGRGLYILYQVFDRVQWNDSGRELHLCKVLEDARPPQRSTWRQSLQSLNSLLLF